MTIKFDVKRFFRFSLGTLMFVTLCVAGYFGGYRQGYNAGARQKFHDTISVVSYDIEEFFDGNYSAEGMKRTSDELIALIETVQPDGWNGPYVPAVMTPQTNGIEVSPDYTKLRVTNYGRVQEDIEDILAQLRELPR